ncbi:hypothetical protein ACIQXD_29575 [Streptomyces uncialis]|uniref:hypothetical protein n=1 Tax=Streptomyces uncialis TaxID=1048205 RepID=UPI003821D853
MSFRVKAALSAVGALLAATATATTASPAYSATHTAVAAVESGPHGARIWVTSNGGPIRQCKYQTCGPVYQTYAGEPLYTDYDELNNYGNRWYHITSPAVGWIYCGNISAC